MRTTKIRKGNRTIIVNVPDFARMEDVFGSPLPRGKGYWVAGRYTPPSQFESPIGPSPDVPSGFAIFTDVRARDAFVAIMPSLGINYAVGYKDCGRPAISYGYALWVGKRKYYKDLNPGVVIH